MALVDGEIRREWRAGWPVLLMAFIAIFWQNLILYPLSVLVKPIAETWGWTRGQATLLLSFHALMTLTLGPVAGMLVRRHGPIPLALGGVVLVAAGLVCVAFAGPNLALWYAAWTAVGIAQLACTVIVWAYALTAAFERSRGLALATAMSGSGAAALIMPPLTLWLYESGGISGAYIGIALLMLATSLPLLLWLSYRGKSPTTAAVAASDAARAGQTGLTLGQAIATRTFWLLGVGIMLAAGCVSAIVVHFQALITDRAITPTTAAWIMSLLGPTLVIGRIATGALLDRLPPRTVVLLVFAFPVVACIILANFEGSIALAVVAIVFTGLASGAEGDMLAYFTSRYFGVRHFGTIYGLLLGLFGIGFGSFPPAAGFVFDRLGSYSLAFGIMGGLLGIGAACLLAMGPYPQADAHRR